jgi:HEPN domain-containing protein
MDAGKETLIKRWLAKAERDLRTAQTMLTVGDPPTDIICFHAQQAFEKALKAFLVFADQHVERTHDLTRLVECCLRQSPGFAQLQSPARALTDYAVSARYPDDLREIPLGEAQEAVGYASTALAFVRDRLGLPAQPK